MVKHWDCSYHNLVRCKLMEPGSRDHRCWVSLGEAEGEICLRVAGWEGEASQERGLILGVGHHLSTWLKDYFMENIPKDCLRKNILMIIQRMIRDRSETDRENPDG